MTYTIITSQDRLDFILANNLQVKILGKTKGNNIEIEIKIEDSFDLMRFYHSGIDYGMNRMQKAFVNI